MRDFDRSMSYFEDRKVAKGIEKLPDGFTHNPVFLIRNLLRTLPGYYLSQAIVRAGDESAYMPNEIFLQTMAASYVGKKLVIKGGIVRNKLLKKGEETGNGVHLIRREMEGQSVIGHRNLPET